MSEKVPVYLREDHIIMLLENISNNFDAKGYEGAKTLVEICDAFKEAVEGLDSEDSQCPSCGKEISKLDLDANEGECMNCAIASYAIKNQIV
tara:strand:+ start:77 stop:352 length:276 start_codon:yes stop_codon:yes gene_type:complete